MVEHQLPKLRVASSSLVSRLALRKEKRPSRAASLSREGLHLPVIYQAPLETAPGSLGDGTFARTLTGDPTPTPRDAEMGLLNGAVQA